MKRNSIILSLLCALALMSCSPKGQGSSNTKASYRSFPLPGIPTLLSAAEQRRDYLLEHYWDGFFAFTAATDSLSVLGVRNEELSQIFANYNALLLEIPVDQAQSHIRSLFSKIEGTRDNLVYLKMTDLVSHYLYDPNSPLRSEDLFLPFVEAMYHSDMTSEDRRAGYRFEMEMCSLNHFGSVAPDFAFLDPHERQGHLYGINASYIMMFFSNPGCNACKEIIDQLATRPYINAMIEHGTLAILNIYIDAEVDKWREHLPDYPSNWINARDHRQIIQSDQLYYVRAIPSLYLLDAHKRVISKDIPVERALTFLDTINTTQQYANY